MLGQMQDSPLALPHVFHRAEQLFAQKPIVGVAAGGVASTTTYADWAGRVRRMMVPAAGRVPALAARSVAR